MRGKQFFDFWVDDRATIGMIGIIFVEILVVIFGEIEVGKGDDLSHDRIRVMVRFFKFGLDSLSDFFLGRIMKKDGRTVLSADIVALTIGGGGIVKKEKLFSLKIIGGECNGRV